MGNSWLSCSYAEPESSRNPCLLVPSKALGPPDKCFQKKIDLQWFSLLSPSIQRLQLDNLTLSSMVPDPATATVQEFEQKIIQPATVNIICPRDHERGCAYIDAIWMEECNNIHLQEQHRQAGRATHMVSYTWTYPLSHVVDCLLEYSFQSGIHATCLYAWLCVVCLNQHRVRAQVEAGLVTTTEEFLDVFGSRVRDIGSVLAIFFSLEEPVYVSRVWCVFEFYLAAKFADDKQCDLRILMPPEQLNVFKDKLLRTEAAYYVMALTGKLKVGSCSSTVPADRDYILELISRDVGIEVFNNTIRAMLRHQLLLFGEGLLSEHGNWSGDKASIYYNLADLYRWTSSEPERAQELCRQGMERQALALKNGYRAQEADIWLLANNLVSQIEDFDFGFRPVLRNAFDLCKEHNLEGTTGYAYLWNLQATISLVQARTTRDPSQSGKLLSDASAQFTRSLEITAMESKPDSKSFRKDQWTLWMLGRCRTLQLQRQLESGKHVSTLDFEKANDAYKRSLDVWTTHFGHPLNSSLCTGWGKLKLLEGDLVAAKSLLLQGRSIIKDSHAADERPWYLAEVCALLSEVFMRQGDHMSSSEFIKEALTAWDSLACHMCKGVSIDLFKQHDMSGLRILELREDLFCERCRWKAVMWTP